ncbi:MAG: double-strand break repair protein AddB [Acetobacteraceae bacterium]|nr:double-strand break repair protein AddB [Acetobacteraceae bacterium]
MNIRSIAPGLPFLDVLARWWIEGAAGGDMLSIADGLILLPTRRAARSLGEAFLRVTNGKPLLLPRILAIGALDEAPLALAGALDLPPAVEPLKRLAHLTRLILGLRGRDGAPIFADGAWRLAGELADLLDEAYRSGVSLPDELPKATEAGYAEHWQQTIRFLALVTHHWPVWLADNNLLDGADRALRLLECQAAEWAAVPPPGRIVVAGTSAGIPAFGGLMRVVASLPRGTVILPGLDTAMPDDIWQLLDEGHPQAGMRDLLAEMGATRGDVVPIEPQAPKRGRRKPPPLPTEGERRAPTIARAMLPAAALHLWREPFDIVTHGLRLLESADQQEEAVAVALVLRHALERPGARAALVTPDRQLAGRVAAELARYGVIVDDSAGEPLADTPPANFLRLLARAVADGLTPIALLSVLKHPFAAFGLPAARCRAAARALERDCLRGPAPPPGIAGLRAVLAALDKPPREGVLDLLDRLEARLSPLLALTAPEASPAAAMAALLETAEAAAATDTETGAARLWALEEGEALASHLAVLADALEVLPPQRLATLPGLLEATMQGAVVRSRRALRGRNGVEHPRIVILGLLEARLQSFDLVVLGGLAETVWPAATDPGPWMSRPMRRTAGLTSPEQRIGQMAHDFAMLTCAAPSVVLSCPQRRDGAPAVPARWLVRLRTFLRADTRALDGHPAARWATQLDLPAGPPRPVPPPTPRPAVALRPRKLSVTEIGTWLRDPYAIFAKHILRLRALDPIEQNADAADYGTVVHDAVAAFIAALPEGYPTDAGPRLQAEMDRALAARPLRPALAAWWRPRLHRIADFVAEAERDRRAIVGPDEVVTERRGEWRIGERDFLLTGVADRIERLHGGRIAIIDYKTGTVPTQKAVVRGFDSQLLLEAAMAARGAFGPGLVGTTGELAYWRLTGDQPAGDIMRLFKNDEDAIESHVGATVDQLNALIARYDDPEQAYLSEPHPEAKPRFSDYAQLARVAEWSVLEDDS